MKSTPTSDRSIQNIPKLPIPAHPPPPDKVPTTSNPPPRNFPALHPAFDLNEQDPERWDGLG